MTATRATWPVCLVSAGFARSVGSFLPSSSRTWWPYAAPAHDGPPSDHSTVPLHPAGGPLVSPQGEDWATAACTDLLRSLAAPGGPASRSPSVRTPAPVTARTSAGARRGSRDGQRGILWGDRHSGRTPARRRGCHRKAQQVRWCTSPQVSCIWLTAPGTRHDDYCPVRADRIPVWLNLRRMTPGHLFLWSEAVVRAPRNGVRGLRARTRANLSRGNPLLCKHPTALGAG